MKKILLLTFIGVLVLSGCTRTIHEKKAQDPVVREDSLSKIPSKHLKASLLESLPGSLDGADDESLLQAIDQSIQNPGITDQDLERGWYLGQQHEKRTTTPDTWIWVDRGVRSVWVRPGVVPDNPLEEQASLCTLSGGYFQYSCYDFQTPRCEYVGKSRCKCAPTTRWLDEQGCVLIDDLTDFVPIANSELVQGWYAGDITMKKKDTPGNWIWMNQGQPRWQNPPSAP